jgi:hypothetical protein
VVDVLLKLGLLLLVAWGLWSALRPRPQFVVRITNGVPHVARGKVAATFLQEISAACDRHGVRRGEVRGVAAGTRIALKFSSAMPDRCRQQLRNVWNMPR